LIKNKKNKIVAFAREAGGASAIAPVCNAIIKEGWVLLLLGKDYGLDIFKKNGLPCIDFPSFNMETLRALILNSFGEMPDLIFTSATSLPHLDMTEKYLWKWGKENGIKTIGVLDQWQNYALRFSGPTPNDRLAYIPDYIFVMDELAKREMISEGIPEDKIIITGQPAFEEAMKMYNLLLKDVSGIKERFKIKNFFIITFVSEALKKDFGNTLGYEEITTLGFLGDVLDKLCNKHKGINIHLIVKLHPENKKEEFGWIFSRWSSFSKSIIKKELTPHETIMVSDVIVGMTSVMLIEAIVMDKPVVSLQLNSLKESQLAATKAGAIPFITNKNKGKEIIERIIFNRNYKIKYINRQKKWNFKNNAIQNCIENIKLIKSGRYIQ